MSNPLSRIYAGWTVVIMGMLLSLLTGGLHAYSRGIFLKPIAEELAANRTDLSIGFTITTIVAALISPAMGYLLDHFSLRRTMVICAAWTGIGYICLGLIQSRWQLFLTLGLFMGTATFTIGGLALPKLAMEWFSKRRGLAISLIAMGASLGGVVAPPLSTALIELLGWRQSLFVFSGITLLIAMPLAFFIRTHPKELGLSIADEPGPPARRPKSDQHDLRRWKYREFLSNPGFWGIVLIFGTMSGLFQGVSIHLYPHMTDIGISSDKAALTLSVMAALAMLSKPMWGWIVDHLHPRTGVCLSLGLQIIALCLLLLSHNWLVILLGMVFYGAGYGAMNPLRNGLLAAVFGSASFGEIAGALRTCMLPLGIIGMPLAGWIFDTQGSYNLAFAIFIGLYVICVIGVIPLKANWQTQPE